MLLKIATLVGILWFGYLAYEAIRWRGMCKVCKIPFSRVGRGSKERDICIPCSINARLKYEQEQEGASPPHWLIKARDFSLNRFFSRQIQMRERFDGIIRQGKKFVILSSNPMISKSWRYMKIPVKGGVVDMAKGKSPKKEVKKPKKGKKK